MADFDPTLWEIENEGAAFGERNAKRAVWFDKIKPSPDWKLPIDAVIRAEDFQGCEAAAIHYTGAGLTVLATTTDGTKLRVQGPGYYVATGS